MVVRQYFFKTTFLLIIKHEESTSKYPFFWKKVPAVLRCTFMLGVHVSSITENMQMQCESEERERENVAFSNCVCKHLL